MVSKAAPVLHAFSKMTVGQVLARVADTEWLKPIVRVATRVYLRFRPFMLRVDEPSSGIIEGRAGTIHGWFIAPSGSEHIRLQLGGVSLRWVAVERNDAKQVFGRSVRGFRAIADIDAVAMHARAANDEAELELMVDGTLGASKPLRLLRCDPALATASAQKRAEKRQWLQDRLACPRCESLTGRLEFGTGEIRCQSCGTSFPDDGKVYNFLPEEFKREFNIGDWDDISAHGYDEDAKEIIEEVRRNSGKVLDCGSGLRSETDEAVICLDVDAFPSVDVLGVNQRLPFRDGVFDAVLSLNVLEHVTDPFACAAELVRVLKPGGILYCCMPFLQPEHGYPDHYFNATRSGMRRLFARELELVRQFVPRSGEPVWSLHWFLSRYVLALPAAERAEFLKMRVEDLLADDPPGSLDRPWVTQLAEDGKWRLASSTAALFRKPANG
jgi:SAM-dependent methyltransferase